MNAEQRAELRCFTNGDDGVVARDAEDARAVWGELAGYDIEAAELYGGKSKPIPGSTMLTIFDNDGSGDHVTKTAAEFARELGRGFLYTSETD